eukprot:31527-Pelagococcus_subviridis.AAC.8
MHKASAFPCSAALSSSDTPQSGKDASAFSASLNTLLTAASATRSFGRGRWEKIAHAMLPSIFVGCSSSTVSSRVFVASSSAASFARFASEPENSLLVLESSASFSASASRDAFSAIASSSATETETIRRGRTKRGARRGRRARGRSGQWRASSLVSSSDGSNASQTRELILIAAHRSKRFFHRRRFQSTLHSASTARSQSRAF